MNTTNKRLMFFTLFACIVAALVSAVYAIAIPQLNISLMSQDPDPVGPRSYVDLRFKIQNSGEVAAENVVVELVPEFPFSLDENENAVRSLGVIPPTGASRDVTIVRYRVRVDQDAVEGDNKIHLRYKLGNSLWITQEYDVSVETIDATIAIDSIVTNPEQISPGKPALVNITVRNAADSMLKDVTMKLDLTFSTLMNQGASVDPATLYTNLPFAPLGSATEKKIRYLGPDETYTFSYRIIANSNAESGVYKIPIQIVFYDESGNDYTKNDVIGLIVGSRPELSVVIDSTDLSMGIKTGEVTLKFVNRGTTDVQFLNVLLKPGDDYDILSPGEVYVGQVDSDDYETADFRLYAKNINPKDGEKTIKLPVTLTYKDANSESYNQDAVLDLKLYDPKVLGTGGGSPVPGILFAVAFVALLFFVVRRMRKRK